MIKHLWRVLQAEIALHQHNKVNRLGIVSDQAQDFHRIDNVLPTTIFNGLRDTALALQHQSTAEDSHWRKGQAIGGHQLSRSVMSPWLDHFNHDDFIQDLRQQTGLTTLSLVPPADTNRLSLLYYDAPAAHEDSGGGTDWHMDGNIYLGARWAGILTLVEETADNSSKLELQPRGSKVRLSKDNLVNSLILFQGDHVLHRVRSLAAQEKRVVLSLLFSDWPVRTRNPWLRRYQSQVNLAFYGSPDA
jgi:hypothetical protein